ncbi:class I SAM-dependent methyltransferase [Magnetospirillum sp. UT-4]|uniref:class I SAM-dependent methyltransferase n=1 Tax=Magnetospirillum sp. UT-4 TaxID=2681467 RepID=UPI001385E6B1|nr:class I SAM-dependent methyltransferase [Magnetospirillum sp. UT-4]CAA7612143.1 putative Methyltransferase type 11 [Magnetospirillum sp. UT-4]
MAAAADLHGTGEAMTPTEPRADEATQFDFWSQNPCGTDGTLLKKMQQRYRMEPWIPFELDRIPTRGVDVLEVGCGQGVDGFNICARLDAQSHYTGIDYSTESVERCRASIGEASSLFSLGVVPEFRRADALALPFQSDTFDFVYSLGVLHHTPDPAKAIREVHRVLKPGGRCIIVLYRHGSLKVGIAKALRGLQHGLDRITGRERTIYGWLQGRRFMMDSIGTMLLECFGVPWMYWYTPDQLRKMFSDFSTVDIEPYGYNIPIGAKPGSGRNRFGYFYRIEAGK